MGAVQSALQKMTYRKERCSMSKTKHDNNSSADTRTRAEANLDMIYKRIEENAQKEHKQNSELLRFFGGLLLFGAGLFMIFQNLTVTSSWGVGSIFRIGGFNIPNGTIMIPLLIGIALLFLCERKLWGWLFIGVGIVIILAAVLMSVNIYWRGSTGWTFIVMFGLTFAGGAMMLRELFRSK